MGGGGGWHKAKGHKGRGGAVKAQQVAGRCAPVYTLAWGLER